MHRILTLFVAILFSTWILAQPADSTYRTPGSHTFTIPTGYTATLEVSVWGGGGGGGTMTGGGGGAAFAMSTIVLGEGTYNVTVGAGGMAGMAGGTSNFNDAVIAVGGSSTLTVNGGAGGADTSCTGDIRFSGGHGGLGQLDGGGGGGGGRHGQSSDNYIGMGLAELAVPIQHLAEMAETADFVMIKPTLRTAWLPAAAAVVVMVNPQTTILASVVTEWSRSSSQIMHYPYPCYRLMDSPVITASN